VINAGTLLWCEGMADWKTYGELTGVPVAQATAVATAVAEPATGLRVKREEAPAQASQVGCTSCGTILPREQIIVSGTATLCPKCAVARQRAANVGGDYAPPALRIVAYLIDSFIVGGVFFAGMNIAKWVLVRIVNDSQMRGTIGVIFFGLLILWAIDYYSGRVARNGGTTGQTMLGLRVINASGNNVSFVQALGRYIVMVLVNVLTCSLGQIVAFFDSQKRCLHDIICGTVVLKK
jgi:uncharacterized RDD family membrane protein YckC